MQLPAQKSSWTEQPQGPVPHTCFCTYYIQVPFTTLRKMGESGSDPLWTPCPQQASQWHSGQSCSAPRPRVPLTCCRDPPATVSALCPLGSAHASLASASTRVACYHSIVELSSGPSFVTELWHLKHSPSGSFLLSPFHRHFMVFLKDNQESSRHPAPGAPGLQQQAHPVPWLRDE